ncbi:hypothetical protein [Aureimonas leprariae]|uniref:Uncharacterized protein n=1 Tax=Plantimonas leprariae TaxID=2615207 RepID=A0A7V7PT30_9HYPH|nr:hypothetical protein [Aureimonas leprariae]KAB0682766.1 hypothetical protein F6X38_01405 [Aureimonas leprariae]
MNRRPAAAATTPSCPVPLELLALLLRSDAGRLRAMIDELPETPRAALALYCFSRYHLRRLGLSVALRCPERSLEAVGGSDGRQVLALARDASWSDDERVLREARPAAPKRAAA